MAGPGTVRMTRTARRNSRRHWLLCLIGLCLGTAQADDSARVAALLHEYATISELPVERLTAEDIGALIDGDAVVKVSGRPAAGSAEDIDGMGVYGFKIVDAPRLPIWLAVMGGNDERDPRLTTAMLARSDDGSYVRYQHLDLPWPVRDRHYVIRCWKEPRVADRSRGTAWEHRWDLQQNGGAFLQHALSEKRIPGLTNEDVGKAVYLPENRGAWAMITIDENRTLVIAYVNADLGGRFPGAVVRHFARSGLKAGLAGLRELGARVHLNYSEERLIHDGFGRPISREQALAAAARWSGAAAGD